MIEKDNNKFLLKIFLFIDVFIILSIFQILVLVAGLIMILIKLYILN